MSLQWVHLKLVSFGWQSSGKSCLIKRYCENYFENQYHPTVVIDYGQKCFHVKNQEMVLNIFDLAGDQCYINNAYDISNEFIHDFDILIICEEIQSQKCIQTLFDLLNVLINNRKNKSKQNELIILCVTKSDQIKDQQLIQQLNAKLQGFKIEIFQTSSLLNQNIDIIFDLIQTKFKQRFFDIQK